MALLTFFGVLLVKAEIGVLLLCKKLNPLSPLHKRPTPPSLLSFSPLPLLFTQQRRQQESKINDGDENTNDRQLVPPKSSSQPSLPELDLDPRGKDDPLLVGCPPVDDSSSSNESLAASNGDRGRPVLEGKLHFAKFETQKINDCIDFIRSKQLRLTGSEQHGASGSAKCVIKATGGAAFKYANLFKEKLGISLDKADEMDCLVAGANFLLKLGGGYHFGLPVGFVADSIGATLGAGAAFLLGRTAAANDQIQVIEMIKLLETKGSKTF